MIVTIFIILLIVCLLIVRKRETGIQYLPLRMIIEEIEHMIHEDKMTAIASIKYLEILNAMSEMLCTRLNHQDSLYACQYNLFFLTYVLSKYTKDDLYTAYENLGV